GGPPGSTGRLTRVDFPIAWGTGDGVTVRIEGVTTDGKPKDDTPLTTHFEADLSPVSLGQFRAIDLDVPVAVTAGQRIAIVVTSPGTCVMFRNTSGTYAGGDGWYRVDQNVGWNLLTGSSVDLPFQTWVEASADTDGDGVADGVDNCPADLNA